MAESSGIIKSNTVTIPAAGGLTTSIYYEFSWNVASQSQESYSTTINWKLEYVNTGEETQNPYYYNNAALNIYVGGQSYTGTANLGIGARQRKVIRTGTTTITHNVIDMLIYISFSVYLNRVIDAKGEAYAYMPRIYQPAYFYSVQDFTDEGSPVIRYVNPWGDTLGSGTEDLWVYAGISFTGEKEDIPYRHVERSARAMDGYIHYTFNFSNTEKQTLWTLLDQGFTEKTVKFRLKTTVDGRTFIDEKEATLTFVNYKPALSPVVTATNEDRTKELTGDTAGNTLIRYYSKVNFKSNAAACKGAYLANEYVRCGGEIVAGNMPEGTLEKIQNGSFEFVATDNRGHTTVTPLEKTIIPYIKLTNSIESATLDNDGRLTFTIVGKYFNGSFGAKNNTMEVEYAVRDQDGNYVFNSEGSGWVLLGTVTPTVDEDGSYSFTHTITGLDNEMRYELSINVIDEVTPEQTSTIVLGNIPVFDWGKDDFNFNVPVKVCDRIHFTKEGQLHGTTTDGGTVQAIDPCNHNNNLVIGYGNYVEEFLTPTGELAGTNVYGNTVNLMHKNGVTINWTPLADFVVEQAGYSTWFYRKWNSGRVELYGYQNVSSVACNTALGSMYRTAVINAPPFPFLVYSAKMVSTYESDGYGAFIWHTTLTTNDKPASYYLVRPTSSAAITGRVHFFIQGSWK